MPRVAERPPVRSEAALNRPSPNFLGLSLTSGQRLKELLRSEQGGCASTIATSKRSGISETEDPLEAASKWVLATLRQLGMQASLHTGGTTLKPMGVVSACAVAEQDGVILAQGIVDYAMDAGDCEGTVPAENVRSQSGLPLPLVLDRFARVARTLFLATIISP